MIGRVHWEYRLILFIVMLMETFLLGIIQVHQGRLQFILRNHELIIRRERNYISIQIPHLHRRLLADTII